MRQEFPERPLHHLSVRQQYNQHNYLISRDLIMILTNQDGTRPHTQRIMLEASDQPSPSNMRFGRACYCGNTTFPWIQASIAQQRGFEGSGCAAGTPFALTALPDVFASSALLCSLCKQQTRVCNHNTVPSPPWGCALQTATAKSDWTTLAVDDGVDDEEDEDFKAAFNDVGCFAPQPRHIATYLTTA